MKTIILSLILLSLTACRNFHEVEEGKFYRSGQLSGDEFQAVIDSFGIKTIINLRGPNPGEEWYDDEMIVAQRNGVAHYDIGMGASVIPQRESLIALLDAYKEAERPILIHCMAGADRSGEASAIYQMIYQGKTKKEALKMLTPKYLHVTLKYPAKRYFIKEVWQGEEWAYNEYDPCDGYKYFPQVLCQ